MRTASCSFQKINSTARFCEKFDALLSVENTSRFCWKKNFSSSIETVPARFHKTNTRQYYRRLSPDSLLWKFWKNQSFFQICSRLLRKYYEMMIKESLSRSPPFTFVTQMSSYTDLVYICRQLDHDWVRLHLSLAWKTERKHQCLVQNSYQCFWDCYRNIVIFLLYEHGRWAVAIEENGI